MVDVSISSMLQELNKRGGYPGSLVCTEEGLLLAESGSGMEAEQLAGLTSLFDTIVLRARRDMGLRSIDEVTLRDKAWGRFVVRPINAVGNPRFFLVVRVPSGATWRRNTNMLCRALRERLSSFIRVEA